MRLGWTVLLGVLAVGMTLMLAIAPHPASSDPSSPGPTRTPRLGIEVTP
jgi:hypothetical protein